MALSIVQFSINWGDPFSAPYPADRLRLGAIVHVSLNEEGVVHRLLPEAFQGSAPYCVIQYGTVGPNVTLSAGPQFQDGRRIYVWKKIEQWVTLQQFDSAIEKSNAKLSLQSLHLTAEQEKSMVHLLNTLCKRIDLCVKLKGMDEQEKLSLDGIPLRTYLYLTCFDLLGSLGSHVDFGTWLSQRNCSEASSAETRTGVEHAKDLWNQYNEAHGNKRSFFRFIDEVLDPQTSQLLLDHIAWQQRPYPPSLNTIDIIDTQAKKKSLYSMRNDYTHKAKYLPDGVQFQHGTLLRYIDIIKGDRIIRPGFHRWPDILEYCVLKGMANRVLMELGLFKRRSD